jgi:putative copper export protein
VVSADDGHFTKGASVFSVGERTGLGSVPQFQVAASSRTPEAVVLAVELLGQALLLAGLVTLLAWRGLRSPALEAFIRRRLSLAILAGAALVIAGTAAYVLLKGHELALAQQVGLAVGLGLFEGTVAGSFALYRAGLALALGLAFLLLRGRFFSASRASAPDILLFALAALILLARARVSHAAASDFLPVLSVLVNFVHLAAKCIWIGLLAVLALIVLPAAERTAGLNAALSRRIDLAIGFAALTGGYIVWLHLKDAAYLLVSDWGSRFLVLAAFGGVLLLLRIAAHAVVHGRSWLGRSAPMLLRLEVLVGLAVLFTTSQLIITTPPLAVPEPFMQEHRSGGILISLGEHPFEEGRLLVTFTDAAGRPADIRSFIATLSNAAAGIGPIVVDAERRFAGGYAFPAALLSPSGRWEVGITGQRGGGYDAVAHFTLETPLPARLPKARAFGMLGLASALLSLLVFLVLTGLAFHNRPVRGTSPPADTFAWPAALFWFFAITMLVIGGHQVLGRDDFQALCERTGGLWHQMLPLRDGIVLSRTPVMGCMTCDGRSHFPDIREYAEFARPVQAEARLVLQPAALEAGRPAQLTFTVVHPDGSPVRELSITHDRIIHAVVIGEDLETFAHLHPEDLGPVTPGMREAGRYVINYTFPAAGRYILALDYAVRGQFFAQQFPLVVGGTPRPPLPAIDDARVRSIGDYEVWFRAVPEVPVAGKPAVISYTVLRDGAPVKDLAPFLAAPAHLAIVRSDLGTVQHLHADAAETPRSTSCPGGHAHASPPARFGPSFHAHPVFAAPGTYRIFAQFLHNGTVLRPYFDVRVGP